jgi:hypothetical protein
MMLNVVADALISAVPVIGNVADIFFRANVRNVRLLREARREVETRGRARGGRHVVFLVSLCLIFLGVVGGILWGVFWLASALWRLT